MNIIYFREKNLTKCNCRVLSKIICNSIIFINIKMVKGERYGY